MKLRLFLLSLALQTAWVIGTTYQQEYALRVGKTVLLEAELIDPRDLLRGDYLILKYRINSIPVERFLPTVNANMAEGKNIFVAIALNTNGFYQVARASTNEFPLLAGEVLLIGKSARGNWISTNSVQVNYGLERYYVGEGLGNPKGKLTVQAAVPSSSQPIIKQAFLDGTPYAEAMRKQVEHSDR
ncbi:MAG: hypothetical protein EXS25_00295 [Pedosphaera sp.]|nr:hypothetical protein [Pedosphaera sp.]